MQATQKKNLPKLQPKFTFWSQKHKYAKSWGKLEILIQVITQSIITETCQACPNASCIKILLWLVAAQIQNRRSVM